jgi:iron complex transport system ATP-binding protein
MTNAINIKSLDFSYGKSAILENVNVGFRPNKFSVLLGRNGSGKSTLFNLIVGLLNSHAGSIELFGKDASKFSNLEKARNIGFLPQFHSAIFPFMSRDVILTGRAAFSGFSPKKEDYELVDKAADELGITHLLDRSYTELSGGEQQLVMIARLLVQNPAIIVLDEPTNHLDIFYQTYLLKKLKALTENGLSVIAIMHDPNNAFLYADDLYFMKNKTVVSHHPSVPLTDFLYNIYNIQFDSFDVRGKTIVVPA